MIAHESIQYEIIANRGKNWGWFSVKMPSYTPFTPVRALVPILDFVQIVRQPP